jgi:hypothetical protein
MFPLSALFLLVLGAKPEFAPHYPGAREVYQCQFASSSDEVIYGWPPGWTRRHGPGFPRYVRIRVDDNRPPPGGRSLRIDLDGGAATAYSPDVAVNPDVQYVLEGYVETFGLRYDGAYISLVFLDAARTRLGGVSSEPMRGTHAWQKVCIGPISPPRGTSTMLVGLYVEPQGQVQDLRGTASFGALWLGQ